MIKTIGIIGGGQLGKMMSISAKYMGYKVIILDPVENCPAHQVSDQLIKASYNDIDAVKKLCQLSDVVTYEFENVDVDSIRTLEKKYSIPQGSKSLYISNHRLREKSMASKLGILTPKYISINTEEQLTQGVKELNYKCVLKTCMGGYDGKGQVVIKSDSDLNDAKKLLSVECILEEFIDYDYEISCVLTRGNDGNVVFFPIPRNIHYNNILQKSIIPSGASTVVEETARSYSKKISDELKYVGTMAVELFLKGNDIYFNEMAPRPHNSGHYTIEGCKSSQFDEHIKAITNMHLGNTDLIEPTVMVNLLGQHMKNLDSFIVNQVSYNAHIHIYGKDEAKHNRKMGHITFTGKDVDLLINNADKVLI